MWAVGQGGRARCRDAPDFPRGAVFCRPFRAVPCSADRSVRCRVLLAFPSWPAPGSARRAARGHALCRPSALRPCCADGRHRAGHDGEGGVVVAVRELRQTDHLPWPTRRGCHHRQPAPSHMGRTRGSQQGQANVAADGISCRSAWPWPGRRGVRAIARRPWRRCCLRRRGYLDAACRVSAPRQDAVQHDDLP